MTDRKRAIAPCNARPGSRAKLDELAARYECGEELWHPGDASIHPRDAKRDADVPASMDEEIDNADSL